MHSSFPKCSSPLQYVARECSANAFLSSLLDRAIAENLLQCGVKGDRRIAREGIEREQKGGLFSCNVGSCIRERL